MRESKKEKNAAKSGRAGTKSAGAGQGVAADRAADCLDSAQLQRLEHSFREWAAQTPRPDLCLSRRRILLIFLLIRHTGAKLSEILALHPARDIDYEKCVLHLGRAAGQEGRSGREVEISTALAHEIPTLLANESCRDTLTGLQVDPGFVRRKFYEQAVACGFAKRLGTPEMIRRARGAELLRHNLPLPAVQMLLGHATPNLTTSYVAFSPDELRQATRFFLEKDAARRTSARNRFYGNIRTVRSGEVMTQVEMITVGGDPITTVITNDSRERLELVPGKMISAEVKALAVLVQKQEPRPQTSAENIFRGEIVKISRGTIMTEYVARIADGSELCAVVSAEGARRCGLREGDSAWILFSSFAVVLKAD